MAVTSMGGHKRQRDKSHEKPDSPKEIIAKTTIRQPYSCFSDVKLRHRNEEHMLIDGRTADERPTLIRQLAQIIL